MDYRRTGPAVPRATLGTRLRQLRKARGLTPAQAARAIRASESKICRLELGRTGCKARDVAELLALYGVTDNDERATMLALAECSNVSGWWQPYHDVVPAWMLTYLGLEQAASVIRTFEVEFVPGLLQTPDYADAVVRLGLPDADDGEVHRRVQLRMFRQEALHRPEPLQLWAVIDERVLCRRIGGPGVMRSQIRHLLDLCRLRNVRIQVLPLAAGGRDAAGGLSGGPVALLRLPGGGLPDTVYLEQLMSSVYLDRPEAIVEYRHLLHRMATESLSPADTRVLLREYRDAV